MVQKYWWIAEGERYRTADEAANAIGVNVLTIRNRIEARRPGYYKTDFDGEIIYTAPPPPKLAHNCQKCWWIAEGERYRTAQAAANAVGVNILTIRNRVATGKPGYFKTDLNAPWFLDGEDI